MAPEIFTVGFTQSSAERFFGRLRQADVQRVLDIRLHNDSQLAAFAKARDLPYFLRELVGASYERDLRLAPDEDLLAAVRQDGLPFHQFEARYRALMDVRGVPRDLNREGFEAERTVLLCSEVSAGACHRGILAAMLEQSWGARITHL